MSIFLLAVLYWIRFRPDFQPRRISLFFNGGSGYLHCSGSGFWSNLQMRTHIFTDPRILHPFQVKTGKVVMHRKLNNLPVAEIINILAQTFG
jgi:hypothetical protein